MALVLVNDLHLLGGPAQGAGPLRQRVLPVGGLAVVGSFLIAAGLFGRRSVIVHEFREKLGSSRQEFQGRLEAHMTDIFEGLFDEVRQALRDSVAEAAARARSEFSLPFPAESCGS